MNALHVLAWSLDVRGPNHVSLGWSVLNVIITASDGVPSHMPKDQGLHGLLYGIIHATSGVTCTSGTEDWGLLSVLMPKCAVQGCSIFMH